MHRDLEALSNNNVRPVTPHLSINCTCKYTLRPKVATPYSPCRRSLPLRNGVPSRGKAAGSGYLDEKLNFKLIHNAPSSETLVF